MWRTDERMQSMGVRLAMALSALVLACALCLMSVSAFADEGGEAEDNAVLIAENALTKAGLELVDDEYTVEITMEGGSGRASIESPTIMTVEGGNPYITIIWSSENYDYMLVDGTKYRPITTKPTSRFVVPLLAIDEKFEMTGDTTAMGTAHEIVYTFYVDSATIAKVESETEESGGSSDAATSADAASASSSSAAASTDATPSSSAAPSGSSRSSSASAGKSEPAATSYWESKEFMMIVSVVSLAIAAIALGLTIAILHAYNQRD